MVAGAFIGRWFTVEHSPQQLRCWQLVAVYSGQLASEPQLPCTNKIATTRAQLLDCTNNAHNQHPSYTC